ncbi:MAG: prolipoprotein diacylglyceryl transferase family protein, partial [Planctomycetota bacterium]
LLSARHPSQIYQAIAEGVVVGLVLWFVARKPRVPGVLAACFLLTYGVLRIATELVRLPDGNLAVQRIMGLSRGQWLSAGMVAIGVVVLVWRLRSKAEKLGGWARPASRESESV